MTQSLSYWIGILLIVAICLCGCERKKDPPVAPDLSWTKGNTLHKQPILAWMLANDQDKMATAYDWIIFKTTPEQRDLMIKKAQQTLDRVPMDKEPLRMLTEVLVQCADQRSKEIISNKLNESLDPNNQTTLGLTAISNECLTSFSGDH